MYASGKKITPVSLKCENIKPISSQMYTFDKHQTSCELKSENNMTHQYATNTYLAMHLPLPLQ